MCRNKLCLPLLAWSIVSGLLVTFATNNCEAEGCLSGANLGATLAIQVGSNPNLRGNPVAHVGDNINILNYSVNLGATSCQASNGWFWLIYPDNHSELAMANFTATPGAVQNCIQSPDPLNHCQPVTTVYPVRTDDLFPHTISLTTNIPQAGSGYAISASATCDSHHLVFLALYEAQNGSPASFLGGFGEQVVTVVRPPSISVTKSYVCPSSPCGSPVSFRVNVANTSPDPGIPGFSYALTNISVVDTPSSAYTNLVLIPDGNTSSGRPYDGTLTNGECEGFLGFYTPLANLCGPFNDTVVVCGTDNADIPATACATNSLSSNPFVAVVRSGQGMRLDFFACPGTTWAVQASTDLTVWSTLTTLTANADGAVQFTDTNSARLPARFYRVMSPN
jgi:hypothetical protein